MMKTKRQGNEERIGIGMAGEEERRGIGMGTPIPA